MPNILDANGLQLATQAELLANYTAAMQAIFGADINIDPDTPDGQLIMTFIQSVLDEEGANLQTYNSFDPDLALGTTLDQRVAINGIQRQAGTHTVTNVTLVNSQSVTLYGTDQSEFPVYTVQDNAGNQWALLSSRVISTPGSTVLAFEAVVPGAILSVPNTITIPVTIVLGVTSVNNPTTYTTLGINEESDAALKIRRQKSVALSSQGYLAGLLAALLNLPGMASAFVYENTTGSTDGDGIPGHSIWVIVSGTASNAAIANAIYSKRNAGCGMKGSQSFGIAQADGTTFFVFWDVVEAENLFIKFTASSLDGVNAPNVAGIRSGLVTSFVPAVDEQVNINDLATEVQAIDSNTLVTSAGFSTSLGGSYTNTLTPSAKNKQFAVTSANIQILPILLIPSSGAVAVSTTAAITFQAFGGHGAYTFTIQTNVSGGSINASTGVYSSGSTPGTDVIRVTDTNSNHTDANVVVT